MSEYLIDTHTLIWFLKNDDKLSENCNKVLDDDSIIKFVSIASLWEITIKWKLGKLDLGVELDIFLAMVSSSFAILPILVADIMTLSTYPNITKIHSTEL